MAVFYTNRCHTPYSYYDNLPDDMRSLLPSPEAIETIISGIDGVDIE